MSFNFEDDRGNAITVYLHIKTGVWKYYDSSKNTHETICEHTAKFYYGVCLQQTVPNITKTQVEQRIDDFFA